MEDIIAIEYDVTPTIANMLAMAEQLAERTTALEQLQMALHVKHTQLTTVTAERDALRAQIAATEALARELKADWTDKREVLLLATRLVDEAEKFKQRAEAAELELSHLRPEWQAMQQERDAAVALTNRYGADQWRRGNAGQEPQEFAEWQKEAQP